GRDSRLKARAQASRPRNDNRRAIRRRRLPPPCAFRAIGARSPRSPHAPSIARAIRVTTGKPGALHLGHGPQRLRSIADASLAFRLVAAFDPPLEIAAFATTGSGRGQAGWRLDSELFRAAPRTGRLLRARLRMRERLRTGGETL